VNDRPHLVALVSRVALAVLLLATGVFLAVRPSLGDIEAAKREAFVTGVATKGPVVVDDIEWKLESLRAYTRLVGEDKRVIEIDVPAKATIIVAVLALTPTAKADMDPFVCDAELRDDRGNIWEADSSGNLFSFPMATYCGDDDLNARPGKTVKVAKIFVIPAEAVPHLIGIVTPPSDVGSAEERVLIKP
jgi:hypothetical protein